MKELTIEVLRKYKGLENLTDSEAREAIQAIQKITQLFISQNIKRKTNENKKGKRKAIEQENT
jgi:hypothetical protein